jgi:hypothetical protein
VIPFFPYVVFHLSPIESPELQAVIMGHLLDEPRPVTVQGLVEVLQEQDINDILSVILHLLMMEMIRPTSLVDAKTGIGLSSASAWGRLMEDLTEGRIQAEQHLAVTASGKDWYSARGRSAAGRQKQRHAHR